MAKPDVDIPGFVNEELLFTDERETLWDRDVRAFFEVMVAWQRARQSSYDSERSNPVKQAMADAIEAADIAENARRERSVQQGKVVGRCPFTVTPTLDPQNPLRCTLLAGHGDVHDFGTGIRAEAVSNINYAVSGRTPTR